MGTAAVSFWPEETEDLSPFAEAWNSAVDSYDQNGVVLQPPCRLAQFVRDGWHVLEPGTEYLHGWHIDAVCEHLEAIARGDVLRLLVTIPPGHMKSLIVSVFWPAWMWTFRPTWRGIFSSYDATLAIRDSVKTRQLIDSEWYQDTFKPRWRLSTDQNVKSYFQNTEMGFRLSLSVGGKATGFRGNCVVVDDPLNAEDRFSSDKRLKVIRWWDTAMSSRLSNQATGARVIIMQRLHQDDLAGHVIEKGGYDHLNLPSEFEPERAARTSIGWQDPRKKAGDLLFPAMFPAEVLDAARTDLGSLDYAGQHQQRPAAIEGALFKRAWWQTYDVMPPRFDVLALSVDCSFKETTSGSFVVLQLWGRVAASLYLLAQIRTRIDFPKTLAAVRWMVARDARIGPKYVEDKANGPAVISTLKQEIPGIVPVSAEVSKEARYAAASPYVEAGNVYLPSARLAREWARVMREKAREPGSWLSLDDASDDWVSAFVDELATVPSSHYDDQADGASQAILKMLVGVFPARDFDPKHWKRAHVA